MASTLGRAKSTPEPVGETDVGIVKAASDQQPYHHVILQNGLKCLMIADPCSEQVLIGFCVFRDWVQDDCFDFF